MAFGGFHSEEAQRENKRAILRSNIDRDIAAGRLREHEREHAVDLAETIWTGQMGNGQATNTAVQLIREGKA